MREAWTGMVEGGVVVKPINIFVRFNKEYQEETNFNDYYG